MVAIQDSVFTFQIRSLSYLVIGKSLGMRQFVLNLGELSLNSVQIVGGKAASLGELIKLGVRVPEGFVLTCAAFEYFIDSFGIRSEIISILNELDYKVFSQIEDASHRITSLILTQEIPDEIQRDVEVSYKNLTTERVAVRSSATAEDANTSAWAGQLDSYMNVSEHQIFQKIKMCWASLFSPKALYYRHSNNYFNEHISVAVIIQEVIQSEKSGVAFSVHPVTEDFNQIVIEAVYGFGDALVSGSVTPDLYVIEKSGHKLLSMNINQQKQMLRLRLDEESVDPRWGENVWSTIGQKFVGRQVLTTEQIEELASTVEKIEKHYNRPVDVEWARYGKNFFITQARAITTLDIDTI